MDTAIHWFTLEDIGRGSYCARRNAETGTVFIAAPTPDTELVDPLVLMLAEHRNGLHGQEKSNDPHRLRFAVLAYKEVVEIVARFGQYGHAGVAVNRHADVYTLGRKLVELLTSRTKETYSPVHADENVAT